MEQFGTTQDGQQVQAVTIGSDALQATVLTYGAALQDVRLAGVAHGLTLGGADLRAYEGPFASFGTIIGPYANRMRGAQAPLDGDMLRFAPNLPGGHLLHSPPGTQAAVWDVAEANADTVLLSLDLAHDSDGFPGTRHVTARYTVQGSTLRLDLKMTTDRPTLCSLANHSYWCLGAQAGIDGHQLHLHAGEITELDTDLVATGARLPVGETAYDFRAGRALTRADRLDINYCLSKASLPLRPVATLTAPTGLRMDMATTAPGLQVYDGQGINAEGWPGHDGAQYGARAGLALEAQLWPDGANNPDFPSPRIDPDTPFEQVTEWQFFPAP